MNVGAWWSGSGDWTVRLGTLPWKCTPTDVLLPVIQRWVLTGSIVYTDKRGAYISLT